ncbi:MAG TPA: ABC transporter ATP-binding protein [Rikenellaceae bacterium]|nr:ABC transporter permease [Bacteroidales bacterium]MBR3990188.1 ABC transporter permease [Bacteroidales bacterium]HAC40952.1 ABC transporter ATP-binding protein [Rikenellaceae bacterium]
MKKWFDTDTFREILDSILRNKSRSILTGFGVFWGIFMLMLLTGGSQGLKDLLNKNFEGFAQNTCIAFSNSTSKPFKGFKKGRTWEMTYSDVDRLRNLMPELETVTPTVGLWGKSVTRDENSSSEAVVRGARADYVNIETPQMMYGRYLNEADVAQERKVCVLGKKVYADLFPEGGDPCGKRICISGSYYNVIGVDWREGGGIQINGSNSDLVTIPLTQAIKAYNLGNTIQLLCFTAKPGYTMSDLTPRVREILARAHYFDPTDEQALFLLNTQLIFGIVDNLFKGINFLVWLIGLGTLLAGVIGVSNIMMVSVKERTTEIGIRRAIGATPRQILGQIISESIVLTLVAGMGGIVLSVLILAGVEMGMTEDGILKAAFQVPFGTAMLAASLLTVLGVVAGLMPASRAMQIKPVDAMRDE